MPGSSSEGARAALSVTLAAAVLTLASCGGGSRSSAASTSIASSATPVASKSARARRPASSRCLTGGRYAGLYAPESVFKRRNNMVRPPVRTDGIVWYTVLSSAHGCVTGYSAEGFASPAFGVRDITFLVEGINLPDDQRPLRGRPECQVIASARLRSASGDRYAVVTAEPQQGGAPAHAEIHLTDHGAC